MKILHLMKQCALRKRLIGTGKIHIKKAVSKGINIILKQSKILKMIKYITFQQKLILAT